MGLSVNRSKTKVMVIQVYRPTKLELTGSLNLGIVDNFIYLGSNISNTGLRGRNSKAYRNGPKCYGTWRDRHIFVLCVFLCSGLLDISVCCRHLSVTKYGADSCMGFSWHDGQLWIQGQANLLYKHI